MARLQDFPSVTPTSSDKILIVQSQGQGLAPHTIKLDSANPTGTGSLSINRKANTTVGTYSMAVGYNVEASGSQAVALGSGTVASNSQAVAEGYQTTSSGVAAHSEGAVTTSSGAYAHSEGYNTIANHRSQHVFGENNVADTSTAVATAKGNYVEIVGNGTSTSARSNARTLDWNGNEVLAGDLTYQGNVSLSKILREYTLSSSAPLSINVSSYTTLIVIGFAQGIGAVAILVVISGGAIRTTLNLETMTAWTNSHLTFSDTSNVLTIASDNANTSRFTIIRGS